jgi:hypothetical protein
MKKFLFFMLISFGVSMVATSCGSSRGGHCDAYGSVQVTPAEDLASR